MPGQKYQPYPRDECGTREGWNAHNRHGEGQCAPCRSANTEYMREYRHRTGRSKGKLYTPEAIAFLQAQALREAAAQAMWGAYGKNYLLSRADEIEAAS